MHSMSSPAIFKALYEAAKRGEVFATNFQITQDHSPRYAGGFGSTLDMQISATGGAVEKIFLAMDKGEVDEKFPQVEVTIVERGEAEEEE